MLFRSRNSNFAHAATRSAGERRISLLAGSAVFDVAPMSEAETRPFVVQSAGGRTRALGTQFVVGREGRDRAWVGVLQHSVEVSLQAPPAQGAAQQTLEEGQSARYSAAQGVQKLPGFDLSAATSWRRGVLVFDRQPLGHVIEQLNRYRPGQIILANPAPRVDLPTPPLAETSATICALHFGTRAPSCAWA